MSPLSVCSLEAQSWALLKQRHGVMRGRSHHLNERVGEGPRRSSLGSEALGEYVYGMLRDSGWTAAPLCALLRGSEPVLLIREADLRALGLRSALSGGQVTAGAGSLRDK